MAFVDEELLIAKEEAERTSREVAQQAEQINKLQEDLLQAKEEAARLIEELAEERDARAALEQVIHNSANIYICHIYNHAGRAN